MRAVVLSSLLFLLESPDAFASEPLELTWHAPSECPDKESVLSRVEAPAETPSRVQAAAKITRESNGYRLVLTTTQSGVAGSRTLSANNCEELASVTAALLSLALNTAPRAAPSKTEPAKPAPHKSAPWQFSAVAGARMAWGQQPEVGAGPLLRLGIKRSELSMELAGYWALKQTQTAVGTAASEHELPGGELNFCYITMDWLERGACAGAQLGAQLASGSGTDETRNRSDFWFAPSAQLHLGLRWRHLSVSVRPGIAVPLVRPSYRLEPFGEVFQPSSLSAQLDLQLGVLF